MKKTKINRILIALVAFLLLFFGIIPYVTISIIIKFGLGIFCIYTAVKEYKNGREKPFMTAIFGMIIIWGLMLIEIAKLF